MSRPAKIFSRLFVFIRIISIIFGKPYFAFMYYLTTFMKINGVYGLEEEKRREEKRREEGTLNIHPSAKAAEVPVLPQRYIIKMYHLPACKAGPLPFGKAAA
jgi:ferritin-like protein